MAKDDYYVIVYQILSYLYCQLKKGEPIDVSLIKHDSHLISINEAYWEYIIENIFKQGFVENVSLQKTWDGSLIYDIRNIRITPRGIEYLCENSTIRKAYKYLKEIKEIVPFDIL